MFRPFVAVFNFYETSSSRAPSCGNEKRFCLVIFLVHALFRFQKSGKSAFFFNSFKKTSSIFFNPLFNPHVFNFVTIQKLFYVHFQPFSYWLIFFSKSAPNFFNFAIIFRSRNRPKIAKRKFRSRFHLFVKKCLMPCQHSRVG